MAASSPSLHKIASSFMAAFTNLSGPEHVALRAPNCMHIFAPASLALSEPQTNEQFSQHLTGLLSVLAHFPVTAKEIHVNEQGRQITMWVTGKPEFRSEGKGKEANDEEWDYTGEYIFILDVDEEGKIVRVLEFLDSLATRRLQGMMAKARANLAGV